MASRCWNGAVFDDGGYVVNYDWRAKMHEGNGSCSVWIEEHCEGTYMLSDRGIIFKLEQDAIIFRLGYG